MLVPASVPVMSAFSKPGLPSVPAIVNSTVFGVDLELVHDELAVDHSPVLGDQEAAVLLPFPRDGPIGKQGEVLTLPELKTRSRDILGEFAWKSLAKGTAKVYKLAWAHFAKFGALMEVNVSKLQFDFTFECQFLVYRLHYTGSLSSVLPSRSSIAFHWKLGSEAPCPSESTFVSTFVKGLQRKFKKIP